jgi:hypothetical protein
MSERKMVSKEVSSLSNPSYSKLREIKQEIESLISRFGEDAEVEERGYSYSDDKYFAVFVKVLETDQQYEERLNQEARWKEQREAKERAEFERLSAKFKDQK